MTELHRLSLLRRLAMPALKACSIDISIGHPWVPHRRYRLNTFRHKGYWFHGKSRESQTMKLFAELVQPGHTVAEVGGHIGFISMWLSMLVGPTGRVFVFEPGSNNLPYTRANVRALDNVSLVEAAVSDVDGCAALYEESLTGQNNSLVKDFAGFRANSAIAHVPINVRRNDVSTVRLDSYFACRGVDFIKIDIEGHELMALRGARGLLARSLPTIMVEVQADQDGVYELLTGLGYRLFTDRMTELRESAQLRSNVFALHPHRHSDATLQTLIAASR